MIKFFKTKVMMAMMIFAIAGCNKTPEPKERIAVNLRADIAPASILKVSNDRWETDDKVGLYMKNAGQELSTADSDAANVQMSIQDKTLVANPPVMYPESGNVDFVAYYPYTASVDANFTIPVNVANGLPVEILYSNNATNQAPKTSAVMLNFNYSLAKIELTIMSNTLSVDDFSAMNASIEGMNTQAKLQLADGKFSDLQNKQAIVMHKTGSTATTATFEALVLPGNDMAELVFNVGGNTYRYEADITNWQSASCYALELVIEIPAATVALLNASITPRMVISRNYSMVINPPGNFVEIKHVLYTAKQDEFGVVSDNEKALEDLSIKHNACRIDELLRNYMDNNDYPEGTVFLLEAGKRYFINNGVEICKGLTLRSNDENNRATVLMGIGFIGVGNGIMVDYNINNLSGQGVRAYYFSFGRNPRVGEMGSINISDIVFENINFKVEHAYNFDNMDYVPGASTGLANYFINQSASAMNFSCDKFELRNCDFQGFHRGFIRFQGGNAQRFKEFNLDGILVYNCGAYDDTGRGYPVIAGTSNNANACLFANMTVRNSSFVDSPFDSFFSEPMNPPNGWPEGDVWNVILENCTFLNFSTRSESRVLFRLQYPPPYSKFTIKNNLFIICPAKGEAPDNYHSAGIHISRHPEGFQWDIANNYSTNVFPGTATSIFRHRAFNSSFESAGIDGGSYNIGGLPALEILLGSPSLAPEELMIDPYPLGFLRTKLGHKHNIEGLYYQNTERVRNHPIFTQKIGDPRWSKNITP